MTKKIINFDATDIKRAIQHAFAPLAQNHNGKLNKKATYRNVEVLQGKGAKEGLLKVKFVAHGNFGIEFQLEVGRLLENHKECFSGVLQDVQKTLQQAKARRKKESPIILLS